VAPDPSTSSGPSTSLAAWGVVVPVKRLAVAKSRLASYGDDLRTALALAFAADVVTAALACPLVRQVLVVTDDQHAVVALGALGAAVAADDPDAGLNPALDHGADLLRSADGAIGVATVSSDLPSLRADDLTAVLSLVVPGQRGFVADLGGTGTTLLAAGPGAALSPSYGPGSAARHAASGAATLPAGVSLRRDVDTPADLRDAVRLGVGPHTLALVPRLG
jgi:2-phospho-L-lactate guanylyltransferase